MLFGGILGSMQGNEVVLGLLVTMGVQLAPLITAGIYRIKYKPKRKYTFVISKWTIWSVLLPTGIVLVASMFLTLFQILYVPTIYTGGILALAIITTIIGCTAEEFGWTG